VRKPDALPSVLFLAWRDTAHPEGGGSEIYVERIADGLAERGHQVTLCTAAYTGAATDEIRPSGVRVVRAGGRFGVYPSAARAYLTGRLGRPDVIIEVQNGVPYLSRLWAPRARHVMQVHHVHRAQWQMIFDPARARIGWWLESELSPWLNRGLPYLTISAASAAELAELGVRGGDITVAYCGTDPAPAVDVERTADPSILVLGRLVPHKRVELAMDAVRRLRARFPDVELVVAGEGWWRSKLESHVAEIGIADAVRFTGRVDEAAKARLLAQSWVLAIPSAKEGWGLVVAEAGMRGTPAVAFAEAGGVSESIVDGQTGYIVADGDDAAGELAAALGLLLQDADARAHMGERASKHAGSFTWARAVDTVAGVVDAAQSRRLFARGPVGQRLP